MLAIYKDASKGHLDIWTVCLSIRMANVTGSICPASSIFGLLPYLCPASTMRLPSFYHTLTICLPCFHHTFTAILPYFYYNFTTLQPYFYHASTGVYLLGNQWCSPWSLVWSVTWHLPASPPPPWSPTTTLCQYHSSFNSPHPPWGPSTSLLSMQTGRPT